MNNWKQYIRFDPIPSLLSTDNEAILYIIKRDILDEETEDLNKLWSLPKVGKILRKQQKDGSWKYAGGRKDFRTQENYDQIETYRQLGNLIEKYRLNKTHPAIAKAAEFLLSFQTEKGDIRGIYGNQFSPNYSAGILEILIKAGYGEDHRIIKGLDWLLSTRQDDGGWAIPIRTQNAKWLDVINSNEIIEPNRTKPSSHMVTGVVLRAFAAHSKFRKKNELKDAGNLLIISLFHNDKYPDRKDKSYWFKFTFPFWFTDLLSALDSLYFLNFTKEETNIQKALHWFKNNQKETGLWDLKILKAGGEKDIKFWMTYLICRTFKRYLN